MSTVEYDRNGNITAYRAHEPPVVETYGEQATGKSAGKIAAPKRSPTVPEILEAAAETYRARNAIYGDNYKNTGAVMRALFPDGVKLVTEDDFNRWCLFELVIVKLTRFTNSGLTHIDSMHDTAVYAAMLESMTPPDAAAVFSLPRKETK